MRIAPLLLVLALAGCAAPSPSSPPSPSTPDLAAPYAFDHEHTDPAAHDTAWSFERIAGAALTEDGAPLGIAGEMDVAGDVAVVHFEGARSGFAVVDVRNASAPTLVSFADAEAFRPFEARDVKVDPAGEYAYLALQLAGPGAPGPGPSHGGFLVYSLADPAAPQLVAQGIEGGRGCHMIRYFEDSNDRYIYCASTQGLTIFTLVDGPAGARTPVRSGVYVPTDAQGALDTLTGFADTGDPTAVAIGAAVLVQPHDMTTQLDPVTGAPILVAAYELYGIRVLDIATDPTRPTELSVWRGEGASDFARVHTALVGAIGERRVAIGVTETLGDTVPGFWVVDITSYGAPALLAEWRPPGNATSKGILLSTHNIQLVGSTLLMAHFHAGLWAFDLADPTAPEPVGLYLRPEPAVDEGVAAGQGAPAYWDVVVHRGVVYATDMPSGLVVLRASGRAALATDAESFV